MSFSSASDAAHAPMIDDLPDGTVPEQVFAIAAARELQDRRCDDILVLDVRGISPLTQFVIIASGTSDRQMRAAGSYVRDVGRQMEYERIGSDRDEASTWIVLDFVDVMIHLFEPATRGHYDLEMMWGDAPRVAWQRPS